MNVTSTLTAPHNVAERRFYTGMAVALLMSVIFGFARSFFLRPLFPGHPSPSEPVFYVHGVVFTLWMILFVAQTAFIGLGKFSLHKTFGIFGGILAVAMVVLGVITSLIAASRPEGFTDVPVPPLQFLAVPLFDMFLFPAFVALALTHRRKSQSHKRWMLLATLTITGAAMARWPIGLGPLAQLGLITCLFVIALAIWDYRSQKRLHPVTLWGGLMLIVSIPLRLIVSGTGWWLVFAQWATSLI